MINVDLTLHRLISFVKGHKPGGDTRLRITAFVAHVALSRYH